MSCLGKSYEIRVFIILPSWFITKHQIDTVKDNCRIFSCYLISIKKVWKISKNDLLIAPSISSFLLNLLFVIIVTDSKERKK